MTDSQNNDCKSGCRTIDSRPERSQCLADCRSRSTLNISFSTPTPSSQLPEADSSIFSSMIQGTSTYPPSITPPADPTYSSPDGIAFETEPLKTPTPTTPPTITVTPTPSPTLSTQQLTTTTMNHGLSKGMMAAILVPTLLAVVTVPILYLCYLCWRNKRSRHRLPELRLPYETRLLRSRDNSLSMRCSFSDNERARGGSLGADDCPSNEVSRTPSPILPIPSLPISNHQESWPLRGALPDPPPAYDPQWSGLRPPSSVHSRISGRSQTDTLAESSAAQLEVENPFSNRASDVVSELSFDQGSRGRRTRDLDELSLVSAMESDCSSERDLHHTL